jgi:peptidoglycan/xylan/chitin deacetylase (PgdA/CDA1 family)
MIFFSTLLKRAVYPALSASGILRHYARDGQLCVLTYHGVRPANYRSIDPALDGGLVTADMLCKQLRLLKSRYNVVSPDQVRQWIHQESELPPRAVLVTCDDGLENTLTRMLPILQDEQAPCLFFVTNSAATQDPEMLWYEELYLMFLTVPNGVVRVPELNVEENSADKKRLRAAWWKATRKLSTLDRTGRREALDRVRKACGLSEDWQDRYREDPSLRERFFIITIDGLRKLVDAGMTIGAHTLSHPVLPQMTCELARVEIEDSGRLLEEALGFRIWSFAYPFGDPASVGEREIEIAKHAGYTCAFVNYGGGFETFVPSFAVPRVHLTADMTLGEFEAHVSGMHRDLRSQAGRLVK